MSENEYKIDIIESTDKGVPIKNNKFIRLEDDKMLLYGINNKYKEFSYLDIEGWRWRKNILEYFLTDGNKIKIRCEKLNEIIEEMKKNIITLMINSNYKIKEINDACRNLNIESFYL